MASANVAAQTRNSVDQLIGEARKVLEQSQQRNPLRERGLDSLRLAIHEVVELVGGMSGAELSGVPDTVLQPVHAAVVPVISAIQQIMQSSPGALAEQRRDELRRSFYEAKNKVEPLAVPVIAFVRSTDQSALAGIQKGLEVYSTKAQESDKTIGKVLASLHEKEGEARRILASMQQTAAEKGVAEHENEFGKLAGDHEFWGWLWLAMTALVGVITAAALYHLIDSGLADNALLGQITRYVAGRVAVLAIGSYFTVWAARNYKAHRHLCVLNRHRQKALSTFSTFVGAARDEATKNAVLLETTRCIFNAGSTGYASSSEGEPSPAQFIEVVKSFTNRGPGL